MVPETSSETYNGCLKWMARVINSTFTLDKWEKWICLTVRVCSGGVQPCGTIKHVSEILSTDGNDGQNLGNKT